MVDLRLNKKRLAMHWHYYSWKYVVFIAAALFAANLLFTSTTPKAPADKRVDIIILSGSTTSSDTDKWQNDILRMLPPDQQEVNVTTTALMEGQESTMYQLVAARMAAGEGNIWILPKDYFAGNAVQGGYMLLESLLPSLRIPEGADLSNGKAVIPPEDGSVGESRLYGIPLDKCAGISELFFPEGMVMAIPVYADKNLGNTITAMNWILSKTYEPQALDSVETTAKVEISVLAHSFRADNADAWQAGILKTLGSGTLAVSISLEPYHVGRESFSADVIAADIKKGKGTAWIVPEDVFLPLVQAGVLRALDDDIASFRIPEGTDLSAGQAAVVKEGKAGETRQYGIPMDKCQGLAKLTVPDGMLLVFPSWGNKPFNFENGKTAANWILTTDLEPYKEYVPPAKPAATTEPASSAEPTASAQ